MSKLLVMETFESIQGEGAFLGMPVVFIRFGGCNLRCPWCDTQSSWEENLNLNDGSIKEMSPVELTEEVAGFSARIAVLTGGEPCTQDPALLHELIDLLHEKYFFVCMETNGTLPTPVDVDWVVASPKPEANYEINGLCDWNELKYVVDEEFDVSVIPHHESGTVWLQPCAYRDPENPADEFNVLMLDKEEVSRQTCFNLVLSNSASPNGDLRLGIQLHKIYKVR